MLNKSETPADAEGVGQPKREASLAAPNGYAAHPAMQRTWWVNLYPNGQCTGTLCETRASALNRCTYTDDKPDAVQVEVVLVPHTD